MAVLVVAVAKAVFKAVRDRAAGGEFGRPSPANPPLPCM